MSSDYLCHLGVAGAVVFYQAIWDAYLIWCDIQVVAVRAVTQVVIIQDLIDFYLALLRSIKQIGLGNWRFL